MPEPFNKSEEAILPQAYTSVQRESDSQSEHLATKKDLVVLKTRTGVQDQ